MTSDGLSSEDVSQPRRSHVIGLIAGFGLLYALTATWGLDANVDAIAAALPAWSLVAEGTIQLDRFAGLNPWIVEGADGFVSNRPPGISLIALPAYLIVQAGAFTNAPATATAVAVTVAALVVLYVVLCRIVPPGAALAGTVVMGLGTTTWHVSSNALWPHGPGQLWAALGVLALSRGRHIWSGWAFSMALLTRPVTAVSTGILGIMEARSRRSWQPLLRMGIPVMFALMAFVAYNLVVFGRATGSSDYADSFAERAASMSWSEYATNVVGFFISPSNGLFIWSPIALVATLGAVYAWNQVPGWARSGAVAAVVYLVVHARLNRVSGGAPFAYRYPLEALMLAAPALMIGGRWIFQRSRSGGFAVRVAIGVSILLQVALVFAMRCEPAFNTEVSCSFF